jgi:hypothetical protein
MTYRGFLAELLMAECDDRNRHRSERRIKAAAFPRPRALISPQWTVDGVGRPGTSHATLMTTLPEV